VLSREIFGDAEIFGEKTPSEIAMDLFPGVPPSEVFLGISETSSHLEVLKEKGSIRIKGKKGKAIIL